MSSANLSLAFDLGTTTLGARLAGPDDVVLAEGQAANPQAEVAPDVVRRLEAARAGAAERLQTLLVGAMNDLTAELLARAGVGPERLAGTAAAANPAISLLLRRLPVESVLFPPYRPSQREGAVLDPVALGLNLPVPLYLFPLVSGYIGGDLVAFLYGQEQEPGTFYIDVGTNGEMAWFDGRRWWATSVAAGPAFEGGEIGCGMVMAPGAVTAVRVTDDRLDLEVLGGGRPQGLAGSGLASAVAVAVEYGLVDAAGTIAEPLTVTTNLARMVVETKDGRALRLYRDAGIDLVLTQQDIRNFQLAKGAVRAGIGCLLQRAGAEPANVRAVIVTGAFGLSLPPPVLKRVAMLPVNMVDRVRFVPGGALAGVGRMLTSVDGREQVEALAERLSPYPLSGTPAFEQAFLAALDFAEQD
jgi:uncharacterized 2Fe-2S/4Fe-4S cluster protein (DUF4445 family)